MNVEMASGCRSTQETYLHKPTHKRKHRKKKDTKHSEGRVRAVRRIEHFRKSSQRDELKKGVQGGCGQAKEERKER